MSNFNTYAFLPKILPDGSSWKDLILPINSALKEDGVTHMSVREYIEANNLTPVVSKDGRYAYIKVTMEDFYNDYDNAYSYLLAPQLNCIKGAADSDPAANNLVFFAGQDLAIKLRERSGIFDAAV